MTDLRQGVTPIQHEILDDLERWRDARGRNHSVAEQLLVVSHHFHLARVDGLNSNSLWLCKVAAANLIQIAERMDAGEERQVAAHWVSQFFLEHRHYTPWPGKPQIEPEARAQRIGLGIIAACCLLWILLVWWILTR